MPTNTRAQTARAGTQISVSGRELIANAHWALNNNTDSIRRATTVIRRIYGQASVLNELSSERFLRAAGDYNSHAKRLVAYEGTAGQIRTELHALQGRFEGLWAQISPNAPIGPYEGELERINASNRALEVQLDDEFNMTIESVRQDYDAATVSRFDCECGCMDLPLKAFNLDELVAGYTQPHQTDADESLQQDELSRRVDYIYAITNPSTETASTTPRIRYPRGNARLEFPSALRLMLYNPRFRKADGAQRLIKGVIAIRRYVHAILRARSHQAELDSLRDQLGASVTEMLPLITDVYNGAFSCVRLSLAFTMLHSTMLDLGNSLAIDASRRRATASWTHFIQQAPVLVRQEGCLPPMNEYVRRFEPHMPERLSLRQLQQRGYSTNRARRLIRVRQAAELSSRRSTQALDNWARVVLWGVSIIHGLDVFSALLEMGDHELRAFNHASMPQRCMWRTRFECYIQVDDANPPRLPTDIVGSRVRTELTRIQQEGSSGSD